MKLTEHITVVLTPDEQDWADRIREDLFNLTEHTQSRMTLDVLAARLEGFADELRKAQ